ncbi:MAG: hypothetical protein IH874_05635 [Candidatus Dadabacteria bacterium]|nr:hypothetical protein [Candidatus Dadabacteria bacterium]
MMKQEHKYTIVCERCGDYYISEIASNYQDFKSLNKRQIANASGWIRENQEFEIISTKIDFLKTLPTPSIPEKAEKLLLYVSKEFPYPGYVFTFLDDGGKSKPLYFAISWSYDASDCRYIYYDYLFNEKKFLSYYDAPTEGYKISPSGWAYIDELKRINPKSQQAFVAMWFDQKLDNAYSEAIRPGIVDAGYKPLRIDKHEHINKIDDEIIAQIRRSKFIVSDFTGQRGGVYFEAGYALGLGLPVIWLCEEIELEKIHFDNRQYNFLPWEHDNLPELREKLQFRIEATIGRGDYTENKSS